MDQEMREKLLTRAVDAVRAWEAIGPDDIERDIERLTERAEQAVTAAVVEAGWLHTQISAQVASSGLRVVALIRDPQAHARALTVERNAAQNYAALVLGEQISFAAGQVGTYGDKTKVAKWFGVTRATLDAWLTKSAS